MVAIKATSHPTNLTGLLNQTHTPLSLIDLYRPFTTIIDHKGPIVMHFLHPFLK